MQNEAAITMFIYTYNRLFCMINILISIDLLLDGLMSSAALIKHNKLTLTIFNNNPPN